MITRIQALQWCVEHSCNFVDPEYPPPEGWSWGRLMSAGVNYYNLVLAPISKDADQGGVITQSELDQFNDLHRSESGK